MKLDEFWTDEKKVWESLRSKIAARVAALQPKLGDAQGARAAATARRQQAQARLAAAKAKLAAASVGDTPAANVAVRKAQALLNEHDGAIARASEQVFELESELEGLQVAKAAVEAGLSAASTALEAAQADAKKRDRWIAAAAAAPLASLAGSTGDARAAKNAAPYTDAKANLASRLGAELAGALEKRHAVARSIHAAPRAGLDAVVAAWTGQHAGDDGPDGSDDSAAAWTLAYQRAFERLGDYVRHGKERFDAALATLAGLASAPLASADERAELASGEFTAEPARGDALKLAADRDAALQAYVDGYTAFERAAMAKLAADPDAAVEGSPPDPAPLAQADAKYALDATPGDDTTSPHALVAQWQTALPDPTYKAIAAFYAAGDALDDLVATPGSGDDEPLAKQLEALEAKLAAALASRAAARRRAAFVQLLLALQQKRVAHAELVRGDLLFSLLRGDV